MSSSLPIPKVSTEQLYFIGGVIVLGVLFVAVRNGIKVVESVSAFGEAVSPFSQNNIFYRGSNVVCRSLFGLEENETCGSALYDLVNALNPDDYANGTSRTNPNPSPVDLGDQTFDQLKNDPFGAWFLK